MQGFGLGFFANLQIRVKCNEDDTIGDLKMVAAQTGELALCNADNK